MASNPKSPPSDVPGVADAVARVRTYHQRTKHLPGHFAPGPGYLDWANQPDPFRRFSGVRMVELPLVPDDGTPPYDSLFHSRESPSQPLTAESLGLFLELSLGLTAWKEFQGSRWALRSNPSSGNLHPTEGYVVLPPLASLSDRGGVYHYAPREHALEQRCILNKAAMGTVVAMLPAGVFLVGLTSVHWREAWKYGERAYRYCQHDVGHALGALCIAAAALGWRVALVSTLSDPEVAGLLGPDEYDIEIVEMHHRQKVDAPSGTATTLGEILLDVRNQQKDALRHGREGIVGERTDSEIGMHSLRGGDVVGDHTVVYAGNGERLELTHKAASRDTFANGALRAAIWACCREPGLYNMENVLGLE